MLSLKTDLTSLMLQTYLTTSTAGLNNSIKSMTTGYKVNSAKDNAAGYSIIKDLSKRISSMLQVQNNTEDAVSMLSTAEGSLQEMQKKLERLRELAIQASNATYDYAQRQKIQTEAESIISEVERIKNSTTYSGRNLFISTEIQDLLGDLQSVLFSNKAVYISSATAQELTSRIPLAEPPITDSVEILAGEVKNIVIDGVNYVVRNEGTSPQTFSYSKDLKTKELTIDCSKLNITGDSSVSHNIILTGQNNTLTTGNQNDEIVVIAGYANRIYTNGGNDFIRIESEIDNFIYSGSGDDIVEYNARASGGSRIYDTSGNDTYIFGSDASINVQVEDSAGNNTFEINKTSMRLDVISNSNVKNTFVVNGNGNTITSTTAQNFFATIGDGNRFTGSGTSTSYYAVTSGNTVTNAQQANSKVFQGTNGVFSINSKACNFTTSDSTSKAVYYFNPLTNAYGIQSQGYQVYMNSDFSNQKLLLYGGNNTYLFTISGINNTDISVKGDGSNTINISTGAVNSTKFYIDSDNNTINLTAANFDANTYFNITGSGNVFSRLIGSVIVDVYGDNNQLSNQVSNVFAIEANIYGDSTVLQGSLSKDSSVNVFSSYNNIRLLGSGLVTASVKGDGNTIHFANLAKDLDIAGSNNIVNLTGGVGINLGNNINIYGDLNQIGLQGESYNITIAGNENSLNSYNSNNNAKIVGNYNILSFDRTSQSNNIIAIFGDANTMTDSGGDNIVTIVGNANSLKGGVGTDFYKVKGNNNILTAGAGKDLFVVDSGSENTIDGSGNGTGEDNFIINKGENSNSSNVIDISSADFESKFKVGIGSDESSVITHKMELSIYGLGIDFSTVDNARNSLQQIDEALNNVNKQLLSVGSSINRLEMAMEEQSINLENMMSSRSTLRDVDMAEESSKYIRNQIFQEASATLMSVTRNLRAENVLGLINGIL